MTRITPKFTLLLLWLILPLCALAETWSAQGVTFYYNPLDDGSASISKVENKAKDKIFIRIDGADCGMVKSGESAFIGRVSTRSFGFDFPKQSGSYHKVTIKASPEKVEAPIVVEEETTPEAPKASTTVQSTASPRQGVAQYPASDGMSYLSRLEQDPVLSKDAVAKFKEQVASYTQSLSNAPDKKAYIADNHLQEFIQKASDTSTEKREEIPLLAQSIVMSMHIPAESRESLLGTIIEFANNRLKQRDDVAASLQEQVNAALNQSDTSHGLSSIAWVNIAIVIALVVIVVVWLLIVWSRRKRRPSYGTTGKVPTMPLPRPSAKATANTTDDGNPAIVVRRRTTSILKKQSLDDVVDNPQYLKIHSSEFTQDSAVTNIYIKNTCIKEIYNLYAEDLRNVDRPKEDGCMVLGRWVHNEDTHSYDVSLESVVLPGDDAVFKEYELNFGGKIKLRIAERLRKLRRDTNLQYDLPCWIHSHPGLGVFFSNSDSNVQMQLKHSQHPNFLVAFVVDILTSDQEMGIFTFRHDGTINSRNDLTRLYSLEEMYKWALESDRNSFSPDNCYNLLQNAQSHLAACAGVELDNSSIIDLLQIVIEPQTGLVGWAVGYNAKTTVGEEMVVSSIVKSSERPNTGVIGCLVNETHMSLPTIQRLIATQSADIKFVMVYSSRLSTLTTIPMINGLLATDQSVYGDVNVDDLKLWTRRRR